MLGDLGKGPFPKGSSAPLGHSSKKKKDIWKCQLCLNLLCSFSQLLQVLFARDLANSEG